jgi:SWI/SNF-related matrix-associated actin-dependent regulator 1 of chromatin subfamily A
MQQEVKLIQVTKGCAKWKNVPLYFVAKILVETPKAYYLYGHGTAETAKKGFCCVCGRTLTHPVSVELGIGPECGQHWWDWDRVGGYTKENVDRLMQKIREDIKIDSWIPKGLVISVEPSTDTVDVPMDHPMLKPRIDAPSIKTADMAENEHGDRVIKISFPYSIDDLTHIKSLSGRRYHVEDKVWSAPVSIETVEALKKWGFVLDPKLEVFLQRTKINVNDVPEIDVPGLKGELFPFQKKGVAFLEAKKGRALIADEMGLGKTIQALAYLQLHPELRPAVVVVPASLKLNWKREAEYWMSNPNIQILSGESGSPFFTGKIIIINYDVLANIYEPNPENLKKPIEKHYSGWVDYLIDIQPKVLIMDEIHYIKNSGAKRTKGVKSLAKKIAQIIGLSGTPIVNRPVEAYNAIKLIDPDFIPNFWEFAHRYCDAKNNGYGWNFNGASHTEELHEKLTNSIMIRRKKMDVLTDLPDKIHSFVPIELDNEKDYFSAESDFIAFLRRTKGEQAAERAGNAETLASIEGLKQLAIKGKMANCIEWIKDFLDSDQKLVVFAVHRFVIDALMEAFGTKIAVKIDGSTPMADRQRSVDIFQCNPECRLFVGNIKAAGVGITLTAASNVVFIELPWTPGDLVQAEDRCHRIGQKDNVTIYYLLAAETIEERIAKLLDHKRIILDAVLDGIQTDQTSLLSELMKQYE